MPCSTRAPAVKASKSAWPGPFTPKTKLSPLLGSLGGLVFASTRSPCESAASIRTLLPISRWIDSSSKFSSTSSTPNSAHSSANSALTCFSTALSTHQSTVSSRSWAATAPDHRFHWCASSWVTTHSSLVNTSSSRLDTARSMARVNKSSNRWLRSCSRATATARCRRPSRTALRLKSKSTRAVSLSSLAWLSLSASSRQPSQASDPHHPKAFRRACSNSKPSHCAAKKQVGSRLPSPHGSPCFLGPPNSRRLR
mmetsp:Transcript_34299/g.62769  ORF Transcript_34299/g.62769 Transcript_34299/m.62769 type:complete len:254 (+) Transcript_34299:210-971(+)